ncbi:uncharacterized protein [Haliotis asinina]|uniref:uncharacterized protein n=1 Tax=Haliotis asinina TaxID=109174 RepID=UPI003531CF94
MDLKNVLITALIQAISCQGQKLIISQPRAIVGSRVELVCEQPGQGWRCDWHRDGVPALTVKKTSQTPCGVDWYIDYPANTEVICQANSGRFLLRFHKSTIELNGTIWDCKIDGSVGSNNVTISLTKEGEKKARPEVNVLINTNALVDGGNVTLTCDVSGAANVTDITWSQYWKDELIRKVNASFSSLHQFNVYGATYADEGNYTCNVTALDPSEGKIFLSGSVQILRNGPPVFKRPEHRIISAFPGQDVSLSFQYISSSNDANHTVLHNKDPQRFLTWTIGAQVTFRVNNVTLKREGFMVNFTVNNVTDLQSGTYSVKTCNDFDCATSDSIQLLISRTPHPTTPNKIASAFNFLIPLSVGCALLAVVVAGIIITLRKRSHRKSLVNGGAANIMTVAENDLYETASRINDDDVADTVNEDDVADTSVDDATFRGSVVVMQENELYEKGDDGQTVQIMDTADIYSEVRKT